MLHWLVLSNTLTTQTVKLANQSTKPLNSLEQRLQEEQRSKHKCYSALLHWRWQSEAFMLPIFHVLLHSLCHEGLKLCVGWCEFRIVFDLLHGWGWWVCSGGHKLEHSRGNVGSSLYILSISTLYSYTVNTGGEDKNSNGGCFCHFLVSPPCAVSPSNPALVLLLLLLGCDTEGLVYSGVVGHSWVTKCQVWV